MGLNQQNSPIELFFKDPPYILFDTQHKTYAYILDFMMAP